MEEGFRSAGEAAEEKVETQEINSSSSSLVVGIEMETVLEHSLQGKEKLLRGEGSESRGSVVEIQEEKMPEHSGGANEELVDGSELASRAEKLLEDTRSSVEMERCFQQRSIYRVPEFIKKMTNREAYQPQFVSLGPLHHGEPHLLPMEEHKRRAVLHMVKQTGEPLIKKFFAAIEQVVDDLEAAYDDLDDRWRGVNRGSFVQMMVTDGCFLLELLELMRIHRSPELKNKDYEDNDPVFSRSSFINLWATLRNDMIAMENQIPLLVLQRILFVTWDGTGTPPSAGEINNKVRSFLGGPRFEEGMEELGLHFLDIYHKQYCGTTPHWEGSDKHDPRTPSAGAVELSEAGIQFKKSDTKSIHDVDFKNGVLSMPLFTFHDQTEVELLNLMAFEWLHPDAKRDVGSYTSFVNDLTKSERDVALLTSKELFVNMIGSDKAVVEMFNTLTKLARVPEPGSRLGDVQGMVNDHCRKRRNKWRTMFMNNYLSNPWVFISLVAAVILLIATIMQTIYTVVPFYTRKD